MKCVLNFITCILPPSALIGRESLEHFDRESLSPEDWAGAPSGGALGAGPLLLLNTPDTRCRRSASSASTLSRDDEGLTVPRARLSWSDPVHKSIKFKVLSEVS